MSQRAESTHSRSLRRQSQSSGLEGQRSRKGCSTCRKRKIKCDEARPECGQCVKTGRPCHIVDSVFRQHAYSFLSASQSIEAEKSHTGRSLDEAHNELSKDNQTKEVAVARGPEFPEQVVFVVEPVTRTNESEAPEDCPPLLSQHGQPDAAPRTTEIRSLQNGFSEKRDDATTFARLPPTVIHAVADPVATSYLGNDFDRSENYSENRSESYSEGRQPAAHTTSHQIGWPEDSLSDRREMAFFLRHFSEGAGQWMDLVSVTQRYFTQQVCSLSRISPLVRYSACALAAKQLGQMKDPESKIRQTSSHKLMMTTFAESKLDFLWFGAKYYEKAIRLLMRQISCNDPSTLQQSEIAIYQSVSPPNQEVHSNDDENAFRTFRILAACMLCQYEDLSATMRAWSGHLDGIFRLLRPYLNSKALLQSSLHIPDPLTLLNTSFWYFVLNDMLEAYVLRKRTRVDAEDLLLWRKMGIPLDEKGLLVIDQSLEPNPEAIFFRALIRLMCRLVNHVAGNVTQWTLIDEEFNQWYDMLPTCFTAAVIWPEDDEADRAQNAPALDLASRESWFGTDICAVAMMFYHMSRMLLLINRPMEIFFRMRSPNHSDLLLAYQDLRQELRRCAMEIIPIALGMPNDTVRKYMLQPLYISGRCLENVGEREWLLRMLLQMSDDLGLATDYRANDLMQEWGIPSESHEMRGD
ncbi:hypothetical protein V1517DRAFT_334700 [Lipomyces orientalis]|uniref:Uncharacterized protein n=1 Tax=Lipomyces orientalis TaxID=1233043 RepID=A0ACC3TF62_9ASCO